MRKYLAVIVMVLSCHILNAQSVVGSILDEKRVALSNASVTLRKMRDSSIVKLEMSDQNGSFVFHHITPGDYFLDISHTGYAPFHSPAFKVTADAAMRLDAIALTRRKDNMQELVVNGRKPLVESRGDKLVLNVEGSVNAIGGDALELLRKSPGVTVDKDDNVSLSGKNGVQIFIDGKPSPLNGSNLGDYLRAIQSNAVESIEIIANPSARYEAAGNGGIINIRMKKDHSLGTNGSVFAGYNLGVYPKYNFGGSFNHRNRQYNFFGNYSYSDNPMEINAVMHREVADTLFDNRSGDQIRTVRHNFKAGVDYFADKENTIGGLVSGFYSHRSDFTNSLTPIIYIPDHSVSRILQANNSTHPYTYNTNYNLNFHHNDSGGHDLTLDLDYGRYRIGADQLQPNHYFDSTGTPLYSNVYQMLSPSHIDIYSLRSDYEQKLGKGFIGFGVKGSYVKTVNDFVQYDVFSSGKEMDTLRCNDFIYRENINAAYSSYRRTWGAWSAQAGLRVENTHLKGLSTGYKDTGGGYASYDSGFVRNYTDFFPSLSITWKQSGGPQWNFTYSRRIDRPAYQDLNPFEFKLDEYTFNRGNTSLRPQYTNSIGLGFVYRQSLSVNFNYSHVSDVFAQIFDTTDVSKGVSTRKNLASQDIGSVNISYPFQRKWYSLFLNGSSYYTLYKANLGIGRTIDVNIFGTRLYAQQTAVLGKGFTAELTALYSSPSLLLGTFRAQHMWSLDAGCSKSVFKGAGTVKASVSDIFRGMYYKASGDFAGQHTEFSSRYESRLLKLSFTYRFGSSQVKASRQHKTGDEDENKRVGTGQ